MRLRIEGPYFFSQKAKAHLFICCILAGKKIFPKRAMALKCECQLGFKGLNILKLLMDCRYCPSRSVGINYRPSPSMENIYTCQLHATSLFIPFTAQKAPNGKTKLEVAFQRLVDCILAELNLLKGEAFRLEQEAHKLREEEAMEFRLNSDLVSPYIVVAVDEELILSTFVKRLKDRTEKYRIYTLKKDPKLTTQIASHKPKQPSPPDYPKFLPVARQPQPSFPLKLDKQFLQPTPKRKINPSIYDSFLPDKQSWLQKKVLSKLSKKS